MERRLTGRHDSTLQAENGRLELMAESGSHGALLLKAGDQVRTLDLSLRCDRDSELRVLILRESSDDLTLTLSADVHSQADLKIGLLDLEKGFLEFRGEIRLKEPGTSADLYTGELVGEGARKKNDLQVVSETDHTFGNMHNFAVLHRAADYDMVAAGKIVKGARGSESHQETRVLTLDADHKTHVLPILYIDENEVKASHAMTVGQPDADQMYYLESRGLSHLQAMSLLSIGYFMPVISLAGSEDLRHRLREDLERKAGLYGHQG